MSDFEAILKAYERAGGDSGFLKSSRVASVVISGNQVLGVNAVPGLGVEALALADGVRVAVRVQPDVRIEHPVHLCFGVVPERGVQYIEVTFEIGERASAEFTAHCTFPNAVQVEHRMQGTIHVGTGATMRYTETHYHGEGGGVYVVPQARVTVDDGGRYVSTFNQRQGRAGRIEFDYLVDVGAGGVAELNARALGYGEDDITIKEKIRLNGEGARGLAKSRLALQGRARGKVFGTTEGNAPLSRGHVDCVEIVRDQAVADAVPVVRVTDPRAQVTHEAAIGTVDKKELETLMTRGLDEETAVGVIVQGMLEG
jgi:Fe-S cluster assembly scaffold protein SufB